MEISKPGLLPLRASSYPMQVTTTKLQQDIPSRQQRTFDSFIGKLRDPILLLEVPASGEGELRIVAVNEPFEKAFGYARGEILGRNTQFLHGAKTEPGVIREIERALRERTALTSRITYYDHRRRERLVEIDLIPVEDSSKKEGLVAMVLRRITENVEQDEAMRLSSERFSQAFEYGPIGMALNAPDGRWLTVNRKLCDLIGYTPDELRTTTFQRLTHPEDLLEELDLAAEILRGDLPFYKVEKRYVHKQGHSVWMHVTVSLVRDRDDQPLYFLQQIQNITENKRAREKIAEQAALLDKTNDAIVLCGLDGCVQFWNKGAEAIYGWSREEVDGRQVRELSFKNHITRYEEACRATLDHGKWSSDSPLVHKDGHELMVQSHWSLVKDQDDDPKAFLVISHDITEQKQMESQLMRAQRMESIGTLAGGIAHDLNNILTPIMMSVEMLKHISPHPKAKKIIETIETITKRGADIVRQVLSFARGMKGEHVEVQPRHLLKDIQALIQETLPKNIRLKYTFPNESWTIWGDPTQLHQILMNLCVNARDAMPQGGGLTIATENAVIDEQYASMHFEAKPGKYVAISVSDTGTGIAPEILDKIFEPFFTTKEIGKGTGLGLSTAIAIVKSHAGFLNVTSELGIGTTFKVYLPAVAESSGDISEDAEIVALPRGHGETVLIVDDEASILTITSQTLEAFGYETLTATDGTEAVALYAEHRQKIAVVLTDMAMPVMDGRSTIRVLKKMNPAVKIIAASGLKTQAENIEELLPQIGYFLDKPYTAGTLLKTLQSILHEEKKAAPESSGN